MFMMASFLDSIRALHISSFGLRSASKLETLRVWLAPWCPGLEVTALRDLGLAAALPRLPGSALHSLPPLPTSTVLTCFPLGLVGGPRVERRGLELGWRPELSKPNPATLSVLWRPLLSARPP